MNAPHPLGQAALAAIEMRERRRRRAAIATRLVASGADSLTAIDWETLDSAPAWLALPETRLATLQRQIGALVYAPEIRLWIDGARLTVARNTLGEGFLQALLGQRDLLAFPQEAGRRKRIDTAEQIAPCLQVVGAAVLLASLPQGPLRRVVSAAMAPTAAAPIAGELALSLIARAQSLASQGAGPPLSAPAFPAASAGRDDR